MLQMVMTMMIKKGEDNDDDLGHDVGDRRIADHGHQLC